MTADPRAPSRHVIGFPIEPGRMPPPGYVVIGSMAWGRLAPTESVRARPALRWLRRLGWILFGLVLAAEALFVYYLFGVTAAFLVSFWY